MPITKIHIQFFQEPGRLAEFLKDYPTACLSRLATAIEDSTTPEEVWQNWRANEEGADFTEEPHTEEPH